MRITERQLRRVIRRTLTEDFEDLKKVVVKAKDYAEKSAIALKSQVLGFASSEPLENAVKHLRAAVKAMEKEL